MANIKWKKEIIELGLIVFVVFAFKSIFFANYTVPTGSMIPIILPGDRLLVNKMAYDLRIPFTDVQLTTFDEPKRGEVIVFDFPKDTSLNFVKRLAGVPGDVIEEQDGFLTINGVPLKTSLPDNAAKFRLITEGGSYTETHKEASYTVKRIPHFPIMASGKWTVPKDHYFFVGDNRDGSWDSRSWGFVPRKFIKGRAMFIYMSIVPQDSWFQIPTLRMARVGQSIE